LHVLYPKAGDCVFIPAGTVHALGAGLLVAEIQQASDCTFRLFDWNRVDKDGKPRALHVEQAVEVIDYVRGPVSFAKSWEESDSSTASKYSTLWRSLVECDKFQLSEAKSTSPLPLPSNRVSILTIPKGSATLRCGDTSLELQHAETVLVPAACKDSILQLGPDSIALLSTLPNP
jgi:mannose-6-phosphate isomerase